MRNQTFAIFLFFSVLLNHHVSNAQQLPTNLSFNKYTVENGLCDSRILYILKDKKGFLWITTQNGLSRFDGVEFKNFRHDAKDTNSLLSNLAGPLAEDSLGRIWISTYK